MPADIPTRVARFFSAFPEQPFGKRQILLHAGEDLPGVFYLVEGRVSQYDITAAGNEMVVNVFKPGSFFPMSNALNGTPAAYFFEASTAVKVRLGGVAATLDFLHDNPDITLDLLQRVYRGMDGVLRRMVHLMGGDAQHRLLFEVLNAAYRFGTPATNGALRIPLTEGDLARQSGLARETVSRTMQTLKNARLLDIDQKGIVVKDPAGLAALLGDPMAQ